jgi:XTP/dITP diphosphohydrolase
MKICFATNNKHKLEEVKHVVVPPIQIVSLQEINCYEELPEERNTLEGNSLQKAEHVFQKYNIPCFADDTGLEVDTLKGAPGVYSARYAGEHKNSEDNIALLLENLKHQTNREAQFRTIIGLLGLTNEPVLFEGIIRGNIVTEKRGSSGFGYDSVFMPDGHSRTFAEMTLDEKNKFSHRAIAVRKLVSYLKSQLLHHQK